MKYATIFTTIIVSVFLMAFGPFLTIWSLNVLFKLELVYSLENLAAVIWLFIVLHAVKFSLKID